MQSRLQIEIFSTSNHNCDDADENNTVNRSLSMSLLHDAPPCGPVEPFWATSALAAWSRPHTLEQDTEICQGVCQRQQNLHNGKAQGHCPSYCLTLLCPGESHMFQVVGFYSRHQYQCMEGVIMASPPLSPLASLSKLASGKFLCNANFSFEHQPPFLGPEGGHKTLGLWKEEEMAVFTTVSSHTYINTG